MQNDNLHANFSSLFLAILKEARINANINQSRIAGVIGKTPSAWTKIENGQAQITLDTFLGVCYAMNMQPVYMLSMVEKLVYFFNLKGYYFFYGNDDEDLLLPLIVNFYNSKGFINVKNNPNIASYSFISIFEFNNTFNIPTIVEYCTNEQFRTWFDAGADTGEFPHVSFSIFQ